MLLDPYKELISIIDSMLLSCFTLVTKSAGFTIDALLLMLSMKVKIVKVANGVNVFWCVCHLALQGIYCPRGHVVRNTLTIKIPIQQAVSCEG